jgi:carbonic anhydrase
MSETQQTAAPDMNRIIRPSLDAIFKKNKEWVATKTNADPAFFDKLSAGQSPDYLLVG